MSAKEELTKLQVMRKELETESNSLMKKLQNSAKDLLAIEEQIIVQELKKEKALIEDLKNRNEAMKDVIAQLENKKLELEIKLGKMVQISETALRTRKVSKIPIQPEKTETNEASERTEDFPEENGVTLTVIESEQIVET